MLEHTIWGNLDLCSWTMGPHLWLKNKSQVPFGSYIWLSQSCGPASRTLYSTTLACQKPRAFHPLNSVILWGTRGRRFTRAGSPESVPILERKAVPHNPGQATSLRLPKEQGNFSKEVPPSSLTASCLVTKGAWLLLGPRSTNRQALQTQATRSREGFFWGESV